MPPAAMSPAIMWFACCAEPHWESTVVQAAVYGSTPLPAESHALRVTLLPCSPACVTHPPTTSSTVPASTPARLMTSTSACRSTSVALSSDSQPLRLPIGVRTASTMTGVPMGSSRGACGLPIIESVLMPGPLEGLRAVEMVGLGPGPFCGMLLADMGAEVLRVDRVDAAAVDRSKPATSAMDRGKQAVAVDLKQAEGVETLLRILEQADLFFEVFRPGVGPDAQPQPAPRLRAADGLGPGRSVRADGGSRH